MVIVPMDMGRCLQPSGAADTDNHYLENGLKRAARIIRNDP
jgi:hypothetical protein